MQQEQVEVIALESWNGQEGKVRRGDKLTVSAQRAEQLVNPVAIRRVRNITGRNEIKHEPLKPRARYAFDSGHAQKQEEQPTGGGNPEPVLGVTEEQFIAALKGHDTEALYDLRQQIVEAQASEETEERSRALAMIAGELANRGEGGADEQPDPGTAEQPSEATEQPTTEAGSDEQPAEEKGSAEPTEDKGGATAPDRTGHSTESGKGKGKGKGKGNQPASE